MYDRILVPVDGSDCAQRGLTQAIGLAHQLGSRLDLLYVVNEDPGLVGLAIVVDFEQLRAALQRDGEHVLQRAREAAAAQDVPADVHMSVVTRGRVGPAILAEAKSLGCDLIVMGTHGRRGFSHAVLGSDAELVARQASVPVLLVRCTSNAMDFD